MTQCQTTLGTVSGRNLVSWFSGKSLKLLSPYHYHLQLISKQIADNENLVNFAQGILAFISWNLGKIFFVCAPQSHFYPHRWNVAPTAVATLHQGVCPGCKCLWPENDLVVKLSEEIKEVLLAQHFSIICDETKDLSKNEQLSLVLRYLYDGCVYEEFVGFTQANSLDAESLTNYITTNLDKLGLRILDCFSNVWWCISNEWQIKWSTATYKRNCRLCSLRSLLCSQTKSDSQTTFYIYTHMPSYMGLNVVILYGCNVFYAPRKVAGCPYRFPIWV